MAIPITKPEVQEDIIEKVTLRRKTAEGTVNPVLPETGLLTPNGAPDSQELAAQISSLTDAFNNISSQLNGSSAFEGGTGAEFSSFPVSGGTQSFSLPTEGGGSELMIDMKAGEVRQDGTVKYTFNPVGGGVARFFQLTVDNECKVAINSTANGLIDVNTASSPFTLTNVSIHRFYIRFTISSLSISFVANNATNSLTVSRQVPVVTRGALTPKHGINAQTSDVDGTTDNAITLASTADNAVWSGSNNTYDVTWGARQKFAGFLMHADEGISEEFGWQYRPSAGGLSSGLGNWAVQVFRTSVVDCSDFAWLPDMSVSFESSSTLRFNITAQNYLKYSGSSAVVSPTLLVESF